MKGRDLNVCVQHQFDMPMANCLSCSFALDFNLWRQRCHCGDPAVGYRATAADADVEFYCEPHFDEAMLVHGDPRAPRPQGLLTPPELGRAK